MSRRLEALRRMAEQDVSPEERDIARAKLEAMGVWPPPPRPPAPASAPAPDPDWRGSWYTTTAGVYNTTTYFVYNTTTYFVFKITVTLT